MTDPTHSFIKTGDQLENLSAEQRVAAALDAFGERIVLASSFGAQAAVMLHLVSVQRPDIPVVLTDTGYLFPETYEFIDRMVDRLQLNLHTYRASLSPAWQEARYGKLWEKGLDGIEQYNRMNKVEPMQRALTELSADAWFTGLRRQQSSTRADLPVVMVQNGKVKVQPIIDWTDRDVYLYLQKHDLPYHPLWDQGYLTIGDFHSTSPVTADMSEEEARFAGLKRECGLHEEQA